MMRKNAIKTTASWTVRKQDADVVVFVDVDLVELVGYGGAATLFSLNVVDHFFGHKIRKNREDQLFLLAVFFLGLAAVVQEAQSLQEQLPLALIRQEFNVDSGDVDSEEEDGVREE
jgi:hypothetical protein